MPQKSHRCSFCGKSHREVTKLIAGPRVNICDSCINVSKSILDKELGRTEIPLSEIKERLALLQELLNAGEITEKAYKTRRGELIKGI